jgi:Domain of unknown function (DUF4124)
MHGLWSRAGLLWVFLWSMSVLPAWSDVYKCPDGKGGMRYQNAPCSTGDAEPVIVTGPQAAPAPSLPSATQQGDTQQGLAAFRQLEGRWWDAAHLANATSRSALAGPVGQLQSLKQAMQDLAVPPCLVRAKERTLTGMGVMITGYLAGMKGLVPLDSELQIQAYGYFEQARRAAELCPR